MDVSESAWLGIDLGTQSVRALLVGASGDVLAQATAPLTSIRRPGRLHEQDPAAWLRAVTDVVAQVVAPGRTPVGGVAICSTSGTVLLTDPAGRPAGTALMYDDARAADRLPAIVAAGPDGWRTAMQPTWALPKVLRLLAEHDGDGVRVAHSADVVAAHLVGHPVATDTSHALKTGYDLVALEWPRDALDALGVPAGVLPDVVLPGSVLGTVGSAFAAATGLAAGTPVVAGMTDGCAAQIAAGALTPGSWNSVLGTTLVLKGVSTELVHDPSGAVYSHRHPDGGWLPGGASNTGAGAIPAMFPGADLDAFNAAAAARGPVDGAVYPLTSTGERFPFVAPAAEAFSIGDLTDDLTRYVAVLQGVAFVERLAFEHLERLGTAPLRGVSLTGGGTRSEVWNQLRADVLGVPVTLPAHAEPAFGMAVLAAAGAGTTSGSSVAAAAARMVRTDRVIEPRPAPRLDELYAGFVRQLDQRGYLPLGAS